ncbi:MAG: hypothetical protein KJ995_07630 [Candidatus Omnitrophica bacterium]|nr:hypothetical protein [Candidatus Omnitrophota bacterium]MBU1127783.1 hypothetical protein [Candidatus Omnitrophota bacterium]MBU1784644.1 hypothetical protein [Candidatus Omnitrophota bacterium]MBU1852256.1 hypothetical protein [Candidatus Omnitrophota bacterium]
MIKTSIFCLSIAAIYLTYSGQCAAAQGIEAKNAVPREVKIDKNYDGVIDAIETYDANGVIVAVTADTTGDGKMNEWIYYETGKPIRAEKDTNADGKPDTWLDY